MAHVTVDPRRCEGANCCADLCSAKVFEMRAPEPGLPFLTRLKVKIHGGKQAFVVRESACTGCMECVTACAEGAIAVSAS